MDTLLQNQKEEKKGINKVFLAAAVVAILLIAGVGWLFTLQPTAEEQKQKAMAGSYLEGSPEFEKYTNSIVINTDMNRTMESPTGLGTIAMAIHGDIRNRGEKAINGLEVKVGVVDKFNKIIKEKKLMVVPNQTEKLNPLETIHVVVPMDGFKKDDDRANVRWKVTAIRFD
ncbi:MAG TPA: hypothetical protein VNI60_10220 [Pyrinomonadaceae bacterium]|nr:hypothetical protein [Pyrinomonadaceae bacterium]